MNTDDPQTERSAKPMWDANVVPVYFKDSLPLREAELVSSLPMVLTPTCRYGHGNLEQQPKEYSLRGLRGTFEDKETGERFQVPNRTSFRVALWRCPTCRYMEIFDPDPAVPETELTSGIASEPCSQGAQHPAGSAGQPDTQAN